MAAGSLCENERGFSETFAVFFLIGITLLMLLSVGIYVLTVGVDDTNDPSVAFEYDHNGDSGSMLIRYTQGGNLTASTVVIQSGDTAKDWATLAGMTDNATLQPGAAVQLSSNNAWGETITGATTLEIHIERDGQRTQVSNWTG